MTKKNNYCPTLVTLGGRITVRRCQCESKSGLQCGQPAKKGSIACHAHTEALPVVAADVKPLSALNVTKTMRDRAAQWIKMLQATRMN